MNESDAPLPRLVGDTRRAWARSPHPAGAVWALEEPGRDIDSNVIRIPAGDEIGEHEGPDIDVLWVVLDGEAELVSGDAVIEMLPGAIVWLPARSRRSVRPGPDGVRYLTVHRRKEPALLHPTVRPGG